MIAVLFANAQKSWNRSFYEKYTYQNISSFPQINDTIVPDRIDCYLLNAAIFYETNKQRILNGLTPFIYDNQLENCAQDHSNDMVRYNFFSHTSLVNGKNTLDKRAKRFKIPLDHLGENISDDMVLRLNGEVFYVPSQTGYFKSVSGKRILMHTYQSLAEEVINNWMNSQSHKENILNPDFKFLGIGNGLYYEGKGIDKIPRVKSTQIFRE